MTANNEIKEQVRILEELERRDKWKEWKVNPELFFNECLVVAHKDPNLGFVPFVLHPGQKILLDTMESQMDTQGYVRLITSKGRQLGISTLVSAYIFHRTIFYSNVKSVIIAQDASTTQAIFRMSKNFYEYLDNPMKPDSLKANVRELAFDNGSQYNVYTAGSDNVGRGTTIHCALFDEVGFWGKADGIVSGLSNAIARTKGSIVVINSTSNGPSGYYYEQWDKASKGEGFYTPLFIAWYDQNLEEYEVEPPEGTEWDPDETVLRDKYNLRDSQLYWRRLKIANDGLLLFKQEYPMDPEESFIQSGSNVFDREALNKYVPATPASIRMFNASMSTFDEDPHGHLKVWEGPQRGDKYLIGADVALGVGGDYSTAIVLNDKRQMKAVYRNNHIDPGAFGRLLQYLGRWYNNALICPENNAVGFATCQMLDSLNYPNIYKQKKTANADVTALGFRTTQATKAPIIANLKTAISDFDLEVVDEYVLDELKNYISVGGVKTEAAPGHYDDTVMALAIAYEAYRTDGHKLTAQGFNFGNYAGNAPKTKWL